LIEIIISQKEVIGHVKKSCLEHELSDFIMELTKEQSREFRGAMIKRFCAREDLYNA